MNPYGKRTLKFKNISEISLQWTFKAGTTAATPLRIQTMHNNWMPGPGTNEVQEAIWNNYYHKKLKKFTWKISNFRVFIETTTTLPAVGTAPPVTDTQIVEMPEWVFWYWRQQTEANAIPPATDDEGRYVKFCKTNCHSKIWGKLPISANKTNWISENYNNSFRLGTTGAGVYTNMDNYLSAVGATMYGPGVSASNVACADIHLMPDDPYPAAIYSSPAGVTRTVTFNVNCDVHTYTTWNLLKPGVQ